MSLLAPLFAFGLLSIAAPVLFHLIRRSPRGEVPFSSLMFLDPSPPRLSRRSRLDHVLLLALRALALALLVLAFTRPFFRRPTRLDLVASEHRRVALLLDTSASMRRGDLWTQAKARARRVLAACKPEDQVAVYAFDESARPVLGFDESARLDPARRLAVASDRIERLAPTWGGTDLGRGLIDVLAALQDRADASEAGGRVSRRIVLIGDLQQGSRTEALGSLEWPGDVALELETVADARPNAGLHRLADRDEGGTPGASPEPRVRVTSEAGARTDAFVLRWIDRKGGAAGTPISIYVPPGQSRVVAVPRPAAKAGLLALRLSGDAHGFDDTLFFADDRRDEVRVLYVGDDKADDPAGLLYYLERVFADTPRQRVRVDARSPSSTIAPPRDGEAPLPLIVVAAETGPENASRLHNALRGGGTLLYVATAAGDSATLGTLAGSPPVAIAEAPSGRDQMLGTVAFDHPLFSPLAAAQFNDFTKIHFWKHRRIDLPKGDPARVLARFEDGDPAVIERAVGEGRLVVLASSWRPADSQLSRSSKFVPLMSSLLTLRDPAPASASSYRVNDRVPLPVAAKGARAAVVRKPDGAIAKATAPGATFAETDQPGVYDVEAAGGSRSFAVNLDPLESKTAPLPVETLEQLGCRLARPSRRPADAASLRQLQNVELEGRQKLWRWLIVMAIVILILETWLAGRLDRPRPVRLEALVP